jgi:hypothetical protein
MSTASPAVLLMLAMANIACPTRARAQTPAAPSQNTSPSACTCQPARVPQPSLPAYSAAQKSTRVQTLADGTVITHVDTGFIARDPQGRVRTETIHTGPDGTSIHTINVNDPTQNMRLNWTTGNPNAPDVVTLYHYGIQPAAQPRPPVTPQPRRYYPYRVESLPPTTIEGLYVEGSRNTRTTPAGYDGNNNDIVMTTEIWTSPDLRIQLRQINDDPRFGKTTTELSDIQQTVPDPALFKAPEGYQIKDASQ